MIKAGIIGASGYTGSELVKLLHQHPDVELVYLGSENYENHAIQSIFPHLDGCVAFDLKKSSSAEIAQRCDVVFTATPNTISSQIVPAMIQVGTRVVDLSGAFRIDSNCEGTKAIYGLPEIGFREQIKTAKLIANPGCYPTSCVLSVYPLLENNLIDLNTIIFDCKSGTSGAGRALSQQVHFSDMAENFTAYKIAGQHKHTPEIENTLSQLFKHKFTIQFTPHLLPISRGILCTSYFKLKHKLTSHELLTIFQKKYAAENFVRIQKLDQLPQIKHVRGSNYCDIGLQVDERSNYVSVITVIDNLIKGAAGQAVQNMNLMFGFQETIGLKHLIPLYP